MQSTLRRIVFIFVGAYTDHFLQSDVSFSRTDKSGGGRDFVIIESHCKLPSKEIAQQGKQRKRCEILVQRGASVEKAQNDCV